MATKKTDFESALARLEEIVRALDSGSEGLEKSLKLYEEGVALVRTCAATLEEAEQKVKMLSLRPDGTAELTDFETDGGTDE